MRNAAARYGGVPEHLATQMTRAQALRLRTLSEEAYQPKLFEQDLTRAEADGAHRGTESGNRTGQLLLDGARADKE